MASSSIATPLVVDVTKRARPIFKKHPYESMGDDMSSAFSSISYRLLHVEGIRAYIHCNIEELGRAQILNLYTKHMIDGMGSLKPKFKSIEEKGFA